MAAFLNGSSGVSVSVVTGGDRADVVLGDGRITTVVAPPETMLYKVVNPCVGCALLAWPWPELAVPVTLGGRACPFGQHEDQYSLQQT
jgi:hypothetical protein